MIKVAKFGGSSVAGPEQFTKVKSIVESDDARRVIVVSAAGKRFSGDHKMTDLLYLCHAHINYGVPFDDIIGIIKERFDEIKSALNLSYDLDSAFSAFKARMNKSMSVDELVSRGEYFTAQLMAEYLGYKFVDASDCIFFGYDGQLDLVKTYETIKKYVSEYERVIIPGFYGSLPSGRIKVMTRGGGDITGALVAAAIDAEIYENWTDVSGFMMADPRIVENPQTIEKLTYDELHELSYMGASVLQEDSILPVKLAGIPLNIKNTNRPQDAGTLVVDKIEDEADSTDRMITGITGRRNFTILTIKKHGMNVTEELRKSLELLQMFRISPDNISLGIDSFALTVSNDSLGDNVYSLISELQKVCFPDEIDVQDDIAMVSVVGRMMSSRPGSSGKLFRTLGEAGVNVKTIAQGADELSITVGISNAQFENAIKILYKGLA